MRNSPEKKTPRELLEGVIELRDKLEGGYTATWHGAEEWNDGVIALGYPKYEDWLWNGIWDGIYLFDFLGGDYSLHREEFRFITEREAQSFDLNQLHTWFVCFGSGERFGDGMVASGAEDGTVYLIAKRAVELIEQDRSLLRMINSSEWTKDSGRPF